MSPIGLGLGPGLAHPQQVIDEIWDCVEQVDPRGGPPLWSEQGLTDPPVISELGGRQYMRPAQLHGGMGNGVGRNHAWAYGLGRQDINSERTPGSWGITKTVEFLGASNLTEVATDTTLAAATVYSKNIDVVLIETLSRNSFLSAKLIWTYASSYTATTGITGTRVSFSINGASEFSLDRSHVSTSVTGRSQWQEIITDVTDVFRDQWFEAGSGGITCTSTIAVSTVAAEAVNGHTCKLVITYAYDPAIQTQKASQGEETGHWRMKTVRIPIQSHASQLTTSQQETGADGVLPKTNQLPNLETFLPETSKNFFSVFLETDANLSITAATNFTPFVQIGADAEVARALMKETAWTGSHPHWRDHFDLGAYTSSNTSISWRCDLTARLSLLCSYVVVTYMYRYDTTNTVICEAMVPFTNLGGDEHGLTAIITPFSPPLKMTAILEIPEPSPDIVQSAVVIMYNVAGANPELLLGSNQGDLRTYIPITTQGEHVLIHRTDDSWTLNQGRNYLSFSYLHNISAVLRNNNLDGAFALVHYTTDLTIEKYEGNPAAGGRDPNEGGCPADQLDAERCTRVVCFLQKTQEEAAFSATIIDQYGKQEPRIAMLGDTWRLSGAVVEQNIWSSSLSRDASLIFNTYGDEMPAAGGLVQLPLSRYAGTGTGWSTVRRVHPASHLFQQDSNKRDKVHPERKRRVISWQVSGGSFLYSLRFWFTISNHRFEIIGTVAEDSDIAPISDGTPIEIYAYDSLQTDLNENVIAISPIEHVATVYSFNKIIGGRSRFRFEAHDSYRIYFATCRGGGGILPPDGLTYPGKSNEISTPGNGEVFEIQVYTASPGGGGPPSGIIQTVDEGDPMRKNEATAVDRVAGPIAFYDNDNALLPGQTFTGSSGEVQLWNVDTGTFGNATNNAVEVSSKGLYYVQLTQAETNHDTFLLVKLSKATYVDRYFKVPILGMQDVNLVQYKGTAPAAIIGDKIPVALTRWLTDDAAGTPAALSSNGKCVPADVERWMNNATAPAALSTNGYLQVMLLRWLTDNAGGTPDALSSGKMPSDIKLWLTAAPAALSTSGYVQTMLLRWLTDNAGGTPDALSSGKLPADVKLWLATAPAALTASGYLQVTLLRWLTDNAAGTPIALSATTKLVQAMITRWATDDAPGTVITPAVPGVPAMNTTHFGGTVAPAPTVAGIPKTEGSGGSLTSVTNVTGDVQGKVLGGGVSAITGTGVRAVDDSGNAIAPAATALSTAQWTNPRAALLDNLDAAISTRAPAATALSTAQWTNPRAALLDNLDAAISTRASAAQATAIAAQAAGISGLLNENAVIDNTFFTGANMTSCRIRVFASKAAALAATLGAADNADGEVFRYLMTATYTGNNMTSYSFVKDL